MGIVNVTPDSFSDGGRPLRSCARRSRTRASCSPTAPTSSTSAASPRARARRPCPTAEELDRVIPLVEALAARRRARQHRHHEARRDARGDRRGRSDDQRRARAAGSRARWTSLAASDAARLPHAHAGRAAHDAAGASLRRRRRARCGDFLLARAHGVRGCRHRARAHRHRPRLRLRQDGRAQSRRCCAALGEFAALGYPVLAGMSRKSTLGQLTGRDGRRARCAGSIAAALAAVARGASHRAVHDVRETVDALARLARAIEPRAWTSQSSR